MRSLLAEVKQIYSREHAVFAREESMFHRALSRSTPEVTSEVRSEPDRLVDLQDGEGRPLRSTSRAIPESVFGDIDVLVRVLGEVAVVRQSGTMEEQVVGPTGQKAVEALAYLALRAGPVDREDLELALFPTGASSARSIDNVIASARALVDEDLFPAPQLGWYQLSDRVVTDYELFCELVAQADVAEQADTAVSLFSEAIGLVRGQPFVGDGRGYAWAGVHRGMIVAAVIDAAESLAELHLARGRWQRAEWAARQGLRVFPEDKRMYRVLLKAASEAGDPAKLQQAFHEMFSVDDETFALFERLARSSSEQHSE